MIRRMEVGILLRIIRDRLRDAVVRSTARPNGEIATPRPELDKASAGLPRVAAFGLSSRRRYYAERLERLRCRKRLCRACS
jgi:hypothetical protein